ncbi:DUF1203 domain-containing protein [Sphingomonas sp. NIBR02145]|uniref:DUF1203 domain-containing protein n=1 Tax=Sphingomonas sp. NIBR02145 TaxID=3014784 RepID=UPI0022B41080|nr:DUF1203 domain-containing protein [Sphingomonas sp. NIBR02145]WHU01070.1 DUF1203 domain-containing protein [Sphingomonas sp. NIBR02145]
MNYVIQGIDPAPFRRLYGMTDEALAAEQVVRFTVEKKPDAPCRVELVDVDPGETVLLVNHAHLPVASPYRSAHAIFVREGAEVPARFENRIPEPLAIRLLSVRAFDGAGMMTDADVVEGNALEPLIARMFADPAVDYLHVHNAKRGCFAARVDRA